MNKKFSTLAIAAFCLASCHCDDDTPTTSQYITVATSIGQMTRTTTDADGNQEFAKDDQSVSMRGQAMPPQFPQTS